jgi:hypothetical protein
MALVLNPQNIANCIPEEQIDAKILELMGNPAGIKISDLDTTQGRQRIEYHTAKDRMGELNAYLTAKAILTGQYSPKTYALRYNGGTT